MSRIQLKEWRQIQDENKTKICELKIKAIKLLSTNARTINRRECKKFIQKCEELENIFEQAVGSIRELEDSAAHLETISIEDSRTQDEILFLDMESRYEALLGEN